MIISDHAKAAMEEHGINEDEVRGCFEHGELIIKQFIKGEQRYGKQIDLKEIRLIVIYTYEEENIKIITCYSIRRKKW